MLALTMTGAGRVASRADVGVGDIALVRNKAATFATRTRAGFPAPEGVVLTTEALADRAIEAMSLAHNLTQALATAAGRLGSYRLAVRSSIVDESRGPDRIGRS
jgi:hypothetical protein